jgi:hypothetical protein
MQVPFQPHPRFQWRVPKPSLGLPTHIPNDAADHCSPGLFTLATLGRVPPEDPPKLTGFREIDSHYLTPCIRSPGRCPNRQT